jgi:hypothetical protein
VSWAVEVQHASDHDHDGKWYEIELCASEDAARRAARWHTRDRKASYIGRPVRVVEVDKTIPAMPTPNRPPKNWARAVRKATRYIRG